MDKTAKNERKGRVYAGATTKDRVLKRREQFLDVGLQLFGTVGYKAASVRALCREAKLTDRYFYESYSSVEDLLIEVYQREIEKMTLAVMLAIGDVVPGKSAAAFARPALLAFFSAARNPVVTKTVWLEILGVSERVNKVYQHAMQQFGELFLLKFKALYPTLKLSSTREQALATAVVGAISLSAMNWLINDFSTPIDDLVEVNALLMEGLAAALAAPAA